METVLLVLALSLDAFVASIAYGTNRIKIPFISIIIIDIVCTSFLILSITLGAVIGKLLPQSMTTLISFIILMSLGIYYLFESIVMTYLEKKSLSRGKIKFKLVNILLIINIYVDETKADLDNSKTLSSKEALYLAVALSLDSLALGFGSGLTNINYFNILFLSLLFNLFTIYSGLFLGKSLVKKTKVNLSWLTGIIIIFLAILRL